MPQKRNCFEAKKSPYILPPVMIQAIFKDAVQPRSLDSQKQEREAIICKFSPLKPQPVFKKHSKEKGGQLI